MPYLTPLRSSARAACSLRLLSHHAPFLPQQRTHSPRPCPFDAHPAHQVEAALEYMLNTLCKPTHTHKNSHNPSPPSFATHTLFQCTAHFEKIKAALEQEYLLVALSQPKPKPPPLYLLELEKRLGPIISADGSGSPSAWRMAGVGSGGGGPKRAVSDTGAKPTLQAMHARTRSSPALNMDVDAHAEWLESRRSRIFSMIGRLSYNPHASPAALELSAAEEAGSAPQQPGQAGHPARREPSSVLPAHEAAAAAPANVPAAPVLPYVPGAPAPAAPPPANTPSAPAPSKR